MFDSMLAFTDIDNWNTFRYEEETNGLSKSKCDMCLIDEQNSIGLHLPCNDFGTL